MHFTADQENISNKQPLPNWHAGGGVGGVGSFAFLPSDNTGSGLVSPTALHCGDLYSVHFGYYLLGIIANCTVDIITQCIFGLTHFFRCIMRLKPEGNAFPPEQHCSSENASKVGYCLYTYKYIVVQLGATVEFIFGNEQYVMCRATHLTES